MTAKTIKADEATRTVLAKYLGGLNPAFDLPGLQALARVQAVCGAQIQAIATYVTADGNLSSVTFGVIPSADRQSQDIRVTRLGRKFVGNFTYEQKLQIKQHWQDAFAGAVFTSTNGKALYYVAEGAAAHDPKNQPGVGYSIAPNVGLGVRQPLAMNFAIETMKHPLCASQLKLN